MQIRSIGCKLTTRIFTHIFCHSKTLINTRNIKGAASTAMNAAVKMKAPAPSRVTHDMRGNGAAVFGTLLPQANGALSAHCVLHSEGVCTEVQGLWAGPAALHCK